MEDIVTPWGMIPAPAKSVVSTRPADSLIMCTANGTILRLRLSSGYVLGVTNLSLSWVTEQAGQA